MPLLPLQLPPPPPPCARGRRRAAQSARCARARRPAQAHRTHGGCWRRDRRKQQQPQQQQRRPLLQAPRASGEGRSGEGEDAPPSTPSEPSDAILTGKRGRGPPPAARKPSGPRRVRDSPRPSAWWRLTIGGAPTQMRCAVPKGSAPPPAAPSRWDGRWRHCGSPIATSRPRRTRPSASATRSGAASSTRPAPSTTSCASSAPSAPAALRTTSW
eukprot:scaffold347_cov380-Prasinococcus_capsulatus_cf.AAC.42